MDENTKKYMEEQLKEVVGALVKEPTSFLAIVEFKQFIEELPYGTVSNDMLGEMTDQLMKKNKSMAMVMMKYAVNQAKCLKE